MFEKMFKGEADSVFKGMLTLLLGAGLAQIVGLISMPLLARLYSPEDFGVLAIYTAFVTVIAPVMTLRYVQAIPLPKTDIMAFNLFSVCIKLIVLFSLFLFILLSLWAEVIFSWLDMEDLLPWWWLIILGVAGASLYELLSLWATRKKDYRTIAKTQLAQSLIGNLAKIGLGLLSVKPAGLIVGQFLNQSAGVTSFFKSARSDFKRYAPEIRPKNEKLVAQYYQNFVWFRLPSQFLMVLSVQAPVLMMASLYSKEATGQLSLALMALSLPVGLIGNAMGKAYYAEAAELGKNRIGRVRSLTVEVQKKLFFIGIPAAIFLFFSAEPLFVFIFGNEWVVAGKYAATLSPFVLLQFTSNPLVQVINIVGSQKAFLGINAIRILGLLLLFNFSISSSLSEDVFVSALSFYLFSFYLVVTLYVFKLMSRVSRNEKIY